MFTDSPKHLEVTLEKKTVLSKKYRKNIKIKAATRNNILRKLAGSL